MCSLRTCVILAFAGLIIVDSTRAGDLNPPAGPIAPTLKTLVEVEPRIAINDANTPGDADSRYKITLPGSYYLLDNLTGTAGFHGIEIISSEVTIDLMGFTLRGVPGSLNGISTQNSSPFGIVVRNGNVTGWGGTGIQLDGFISGGQNLIENVLVSDCAGNSGVRCFKNCIIKDSVFSNNAGYGLFCVEQCVIERCIAFNNGVDGLRGEILCIFKDCIARDNVGAGLYAGIHVSFTNCKSYSNTGNGFWSFGFSNQAFNCEAISNSGGGIILGSTAIIDSCRASNNTGEGINVSTSSTVRNSAATANMSSGIRVAGNCIVTGNLSQAHVSAAGFHVTGARGRIEGNLAVDNLRGVDIDGQFNVVIRNTCSNNTTNWDIVANNVVGPILDRSVPASAAILGNSAPSSLGTTEPNANFTH